MAHDPTDVRTDTAPPAVRLPMLLNAGFSLLTGLLLALVPSTVGGWLGVSVDGWLRLFGIGLVIHAVVLAVTAQSSQPNRWARVNLMMIAPYPLVLLVVVLTQLVDTGTGRVLVLADAAVLAVISLLHWRALGSAAPFPGVRTTAAS